MHEEVDATSEIKSLGYFIDGEGGVVLGAPVKIGKVTCVLESLSRRPRVSGKQVERILGHAIHLPLVRRELLACIRSLYDFVQSYYDKRVRLCKPLAQECAVLGSLLKIAFTDFKRPFSEHVLISDACKTAIAVHQAKWSISDVSQVASLPEESRFQSEFDCANARPHA